MKLRTRIIWICCISIFAALLVGDMIIWVLAGKSLMNEAMVSAYRDTFLVVNDFKEHLDKTYSMGMEVDSIYLNYLLKSYQDDFNICIRRFDDMPEEEIYNHTIFKAEDFTNQEYRLYDGDVFYTKVRWENKTYIIFYYSAGEGIYLYRMCDISDVENKIEWLIGATLLLLVFLTAAASIILHMVLKRVLQPLKELNETTKSMKDNMYGQRVKIHRMDEIGQLGENFNRMAEAVEARTRSLEESEQKKTLFMGDLTHELKTPLTAISGYAQTLLTAKITEEEKEEALLYIYEECNRLSRLSKKMMRLLELDREEELEMTQTPVKELFERTQRACSTILKEKQLTLCCEEHGEILPMDVDLMTDVLINLIDNAAKASSEGNKIMLKAYERCIEVEDFGQGIPEEEMGKIMEPFYMIDKSRSRKKGGAGLGLALTAMIAKRHGITIETESRLGEGTRFILQFV